MSPELFIGARGWDYDAWAGGFYPEDLPREWRLAYYAHEFRAVLVPFEAAMASSGQTVLTWLEDTPDAFRFFLELKTIPGLGSELPKFRPLAQRLGGFLLKTDDGRPAAPLELREMLTSLAAHPVGLAGASDHSGLTEALAAGAASFYSAGQQGPGVSCPLVMGCLRPTVTLRELPARIADFLSYAAQSAQAALFLDGQPPDIILLRRARVVAELLGH
jgi:hypothetical protein